MTSFLIIMWKVTNSIFELFIEFAVIGSKDAFLDTARELAAPSTVLFFV